MVEHDETQTVPVRAEARVRVNHHLLFPALSEVEQEVGDLVEEGEVLATNTTLLGQEQARLVAPENGVLLGMTTHPMVVPGDAVYHLGLLDQQLERFEKAVGRVPEDSLHERVRGDLSTSVHVDLVDDEVPEAPASDTE